MKKITSICKKLNLKSKDIIPYGYYKAKINNIENPSKQGKIVLVSAITPTKYGEGKTTNAISITDSLNAIGVCTILNLREPSLGPVFGLKGGATGGGKNSIIPDMDINLHFNGDFHAITSANNLIACCIDNTIYYGNSLNLDPNTIKFKRCIDMNDRVLREFTIKDKKDSEPRKEGFVITAASELMAIFCLATSLEDFLDRVENILIGYTYSNEEVLVKQLHIRNAIKLLIKDALKSNLVQTGYASPCIIHGGPFANIACGCNSLISLKQSLCLADVVVTEAGFGADLGAEKFINIISRVGNIKPSVVCLVVTLRALKLHGGALETELDKENIQALQEGFKNMDRHIENLQNFNVKVVVSISKFSFDTKKELDLVCSYLKNKGIKYAINTSYTDGIKGGLSLAQVIKEELEKEDKELSFTYEFNQTIEEKITAIAKKIYHASKVEFSSEALEDIRLIEKYHHDILPICMAKTPNSFSDDPKLLNAPNDFTLHIKRVNLSLGASLIVPLTGNVMLLPGLPKVPNACNMED